MGSKTLRRRGMPAAIAICAAGLLSLTGPTLAGATIYPAGGGVFDAGAEGWQEVEASCNVSALSTCEASGEFDGSAGDPPGSLTAHTHLVLNLAALFESTVVIESPDFTVAEGGSGTLRVDRQFSPGGLVALSPEAGYSVALIDGGSEASSEAVSETLGESDGAFAGRSGAITVSAGHTYAIAIATTTTALAAVGPLETDSFVRFDEVSLETEPSAEQGGAGEAGSAVGEGGATGASPATNSASERTVVERRVGRKRRWRARHVFVRLRCPRRLHHACTITAQGRIGKRIRVTQRRTVRLARGRGRLVALRVKRRFRGQVAKRRRLLVVQRLRAGKRKATFAGSRPVIRHR